MKIVISMRDISVSATSKKYRPKPYVGASNVSKEDLLEGTKIFIWGAKAGPIVLGSNFFKIVYGLYDNEDLERLLAASKDKAARDFIKTLRLFKNGGEVTRVSRIFAEGLRNELVGFGPDNNFIGFSVESAGKAKKLAQHAEKNYEK